MYTPGHFEVSDEDTLFNFIEANGFAQLVSQVDGELFATHLPLLLDRDRRVLLGHVARANPQWQSLAGQDVLVMFAGPHGYVSPSWYEEGGVPTWNYQAVHVRGRADVFEGTEAMRELVNALTAQYEAALPSPWQPDYRDVMLSAIIGLEIPLQQVQGKFKLSQNRSEQDRRTVASELTGLGQEPLARAMEDLL